MKKISTKKPKAVKAAATLEASGSQAAPPAPAKKPAPQPTRTVIEAKIDIGFGNTLYIRGEGPGLSWDKGLVMDCIADNQWVITISDAVAPIIFKFLVNDLTWCVGNDFIVEPGASFTTEPLF